MIYHFEHSEIDTERYQLAHNGAPVPVEPQVFDLLLYLIENRDRVVARDELLEKLWPGKVVTDAALSARLKAVRKAVGDSGREQKLIKTIHGRGYQFVAPVTERAQARDSSGAISDWFNTNDPYDLADVPSIAVLPFQNLSGDAEQDWFAEGMSQAVSTALSRLSNLFVVSNYSSHAVREETSLKQLALDQGIDFLLEGSVVKSGSRVRVTAQLVAAKSGRQRWADRYDRELDDIFAVQDDITKNIIVALQVRLVHGETAETWAAGTKSVDAWICTVRGLDTLDLECERDVEEAKRLAEKALELDPDYVGAWSLLGFVYADASLFEWGGSRQDLLQKGFDAVRRGQELEPDNANNLAVLGYLHILAEAYDNAIEILQRAAALGPSSMDCLGMYGYVLACTGHPHDALRQFEEAIRHCPHYPPWINVMRGLCYLLTGRLNEATSALQESVARQPESPYGMPWLIVALATQEATTDARSVAEDLLRIEPAFTASRWYQLTLQDKTLSRELEARLVEAGIPA